MTDFNYIGFRKGHGHPVVHGRSLDLAEHAASILRISEVEFQFLGIFGPYVWAEKVALNSVRWGPQNPDADSNEDTHAAAITE